MDRHNEWRKQVRLLLQILPFVSRENCFALKGGTAINLFVRDLPRLSVDIDLVYLPADDRETALAETGAALGRVADALEGALPDIRVLRNYEAKSDALRIVASSRDATVKVELSPVLRGTVLEPAVVPVTPAVEEEFGFAEINMVAMEDLYAGKLCAALDRQHPRDWFDVMLLLESKGIDDALRKVFLIYLISHGRPMEELLAPNWRLQKSLFDSEFVGMTRRNVTLHELHEAAVSALSKILDGMRREEKAFLCSVYECAPDWSLLALPGVEMLPAVKWKLRNIQRMSVEKRTTSLERLKTLLNFAE
ncbi:nucleotidyl transferase AbiEii/AbiGii toxin family protein [Microbulbifer halophilus]|uniref:Nucleotidyl transferase AbiEii/AbiGii toxin family protein n=1 Tax=Microbulbifer halophilus TaxID=453963 RepID=A0ABW5ECQ0_9GAMM|nr:nucleotidyl transferase AbiEii/AbiGii toxin family protein [Microbulbifer halophilus]MCW8127553.1 nucleotidyl transferase AbiEii/AbiGii toxin family protein [Microbulbifer halophilus]